MRQRRLRAAYSLALAATVLAIALWRLDLVAGAWRATSMSLARGGTARWHVASEVALFAGILAAAWKSLTSSARPARDASSIVIAAVIGWLAEAWGTRLGLWSYYTGERPPLWIVPAWPIGALVVERAAAALHQRFGPARRGIYVLLAASALGATLAFCAGRGASIASWLGPAATAAGLCLYARPAQETWTLAAGLGCVLFADLWGTTNGCWTYYLGRSPLGLASGVGFGMAFDAALVVGCLRLARAAEPLINFCIEFLSKEPHNSVITPRRRP